MPSPVQQDMFAPIEEVDEWALKSAIQKGFRRNDPELIVRAFDYLWANKRSWVLWRYMVLPIEDGWKSVSYMGTAWAKASDAIKGVKDQKVIYEAGEKLKEALLAAAATKKNQDGNGQVWLAQRLIDTGPNEMHKELEKFRNLVDDVKFRHLKSLVGFMMTSRGVPPPSSPWDYIYRNLDKESPTLESDSLFIDAVFKRASMGGSPGYQQLFISAGLLALYGHKFGSYGDLDQQPSSVSRLSDFSGTVPDRGILPWYCFDMHTQIGKKALSHTAKVFSELYSKSFIEDLWFMEETAKVNESEGLWWEVGREHYYNSHGLTVDKAEEIWSKVGAVIKSKVENLVREKYGQ